MHSALVDLRKDSRLVSLDRRLLHAQMFGRHFTPFVLVFSHLCNASSLTSRGLIGQDVLDEGIQAWDLRLSRYRGSGLRKVSSCLHAGLDTRTA